MVNLELKPDSLNVLLTFRLEVSWMKILTCFWGMAELGQVYLPPNKHPIPLLNPETVGAGLLCNCLLGKLGSLLTNLELF